MSTNRRYVSAEEKAAEWGLSPRRVQIFLQQGRIPGAYKVGRTWIVPGGAKRPKDARFKKKKYDDAAPPAEEQTGTGEAASAVVDGTGSPTDVRQEQDDVVAEGQAGTEADGAMVPVGPTDAYPEPEEDDEPAQPPAAPPLYQWRQ